MPLLTKEQANTAYEALKLLQDTAKTARVELGDNGPVVEYNAPVPGRLNLTTLVVYAKPFNSLYDESTEIYTNLWSFAVTYEL